LEAWPWHLKSQRKSAVDVARPEQRQEGAARVEKSAAEKRAKQTSIIEFRGEQAFQ